MMIFNDEVYAAVLKRRDSKADMCWRWQTTLKPMIVEYIKKDDNFLQIKLSDLMEKSGYNPNCKNDYLLARATIPMLIREFEASWLELNWIAKDEVLIIYW